MIKRPIIKLLFAVLFLTAACQKETIKEGNNSESENAKKGGQKISAAPPAGTLIDGAIYRIRGISSLPGGPVVEVTGNSTAENSAIQQWSWFPNNGQKWKLIKIDSPYYKLANITSSKYLKSPSATSGDILQQGTDDGTDSQLWKITYSGSNNLYSLTNKATGMKMVVDPEDNTPGRKIRQKTTVSGTQDLFNFHNLNFQNPLINASRPDPYVAQKDGYYYFMYTRGSSLGIRKTTSMSLLATAQEVVVWTPPAGTDHSSNIWAPELHFLSGKWYLYFAANDGQGDNHRMFVLENSNSDPTTGTWTYKGKITDSSDQWAIDGSVLTIGSSMYFIWSGWESVASRYKQYIYLATMSNPWTINGPRVKISSPTNTWEKYEPNSLGAGVNEGPIMLQKDAGSPVFIIFSASRYSSDNYCLAQIQLKAGGNPTVASDWINKKQVFVKNETNSVYGPGHNGFFTSSYTDPNAVLRTETWFVYHARSAPNNTGPRTPRMQKLTWNADGSPNFGTATSTGVNIPIPIGE
ncbi:GH43 family beta-xylosidase [Arcticibacter tournemirensis]|uniref:Family 43 glycosylhydrolase n=1 Tax=Arcticibacter tournemirensis TaxID=699437 RepID=A0A5M9H9B1_9SPHI|nr:family 43 glycosylhydrolase [Arcticibacter tournemirensis]KAA8481844.1 family 43 glycosylhydrolase [Arcticibacter tournemirensis]TQM50119.1 GH43 family beta-xylosidase [Arcticibacter tournemirensis]